MSVTYYWLTHSRLVNLIDVTLACEDANSKLVDIVTVANVSDRSLGRPMVCARHCCGAGNRRKSKSFWLFVYSLLSVSSIAAVLRWKYNWQIWNCKQQLVYMVSVPKRNIAQKKGIALASRSGSWSGGSRGHLHSVRVVDGRGVEDEAGPVPAVGLV